MRAIAILFFLLVAVCSPGFAQQDSSAQSTNKPAFQHPGSMQVLDSVIIATAAHERYKQDSINFALIKYPDSTLNERNWDRLKSELYHGNEFLDIPFRSKSILRDGHVRPVRDPWIVVIIISLLIYTALLNIIMNKDIQNVVLSFYSKRVLSQAGKEDGQINFWAFVGLFLLFGLTFGLFLYQYAAYKGVYYSVSGSRLFFSLTLIILILFAAKFLVLKFVGFIFDIQKLVTEYVSVLYLTYFNIAFVFLPVTVCFSLLAVQYVPYLLAVAVTLIVVIFTWLYLRSSVNIISNFRFHKFYLFIYLCALEICPVLILIKALYI